LSFNGVGVVTDSVVCQICGDPIDVMVTDPSDLQDAYVGLRGQWVWLQDLDAAVFILDPSSELTVVELPGGRLAILPDEEGRPTIHNHKDCYEQATHCEEIEWDGEDMIEGTG